MDPDRLLDGLDASQQRAVTSVAQPLAIVAGAGSGKTRVLTRRIAYRCLTGTADPRHVLALTFTRRAAAELDARLRSFGLRDLPASGTFHAIAYAQLRTRWTGASQAAPQLLDRKGPMLRKIVGSSGRFTAADLAAEIEWARARLVDPDRYPIAAAQADRRIAAPPDRIAEWYRRYETEKRRRGVVDFDDLLSLCADALQVDPAFAAAQRWRFRHLFVDEYQDLNPLQERLLNAWLGDSVDLAVVGDPNQAIYGWNGADPSLLNDFTRRHPGAEVIRLEHSYRSTPQIIEAAAAVLTSATPGGVAMLQAHRGDGPIPTIVGYTTDMDEANGIARAVHDHHVPGKGWSEQAVLVRTNAQTSLIEAAFRRAAIPHRVRGAAHLLDQPDVKDLLRSFERSRDPLATTLADLEASIAELRDSLGAADVTVLDGAGSSTAERRVASTEQILRLGRDLLVVEPTARTEGFGGWLRTTLQDVETHRRDAVAIVSFHAAKGLEWSVVHLAGIEAGLVPVTHAKTPDQQAEEQRLFYVAITRAADVVRCSWAAQRTFGAQTVDRKPSPYLIKVRDVTARLAQADRRAASPDAAVSQSRQHLAHDDSADDGGRRRHQVRDALTIWRAEEARKGAVKPTVVLSDKALETLARLRPTNPAELAALDDIGPSLRSRHGARLLAICGSNSPSASTIPQSS